MARGKKRGPTLMDKRREAEAAEAREKDPEAREEEEAESAEEEVEEGDDEDAPKKKKATKKAKVPTVKKPAVKRVRTPKEVRQKAMWAVYDNASKLVDEFPYSQKADAEALLARKIEEKKTTFYMNLVKRAID